MKSSFHILHAVTAVWSNSVVLLVLASSVCESEKYISLLPQTSVSNYRWRHTGEDDTANSVGADGWSVGGRITETVLVRFALQSFTVTRKSHW